MLIELTPFVVLALLGALHCAGMCGGFAIAASESSRGFGGVACYVLGKALTYALLGVAAAVVGGAALQVVERRYVAWTVGVFLCGSGLAALGLLRGPRVGRVPRWTRAAFAGVRRLHGPPAAFGIGVLTGLLPCGLSWSALVLAAQSRPATALLGLFAFGIATGPGLVGVAAGWRWAPVSWRARARFVLGPALLAFGVLTIARAEGHALPRPLHALVPECCAQSP